MGVCRETVVLGPMVLANMQLWCLKHGHVELDLVCIEQCRTGIWNMCKQSSHRTWVWPHRSTWNSYGFKEQKCMCVFGRMVIQGACVFSE